MDFTELVTVVVLTVVIAAATVAILVYRNQSRQSATVMRKSIQIELAVGEVPDAVFHTGDAAQDFEIVDGYEFDEVSLGDADPDLDPDLDAGYAAAGTSSVRPWLKLARPSWQAPPPSPARSPTPPKKSLGAVRINPAFEAAPARSPSPSSTASERVAVTIMPTKQQGLGVVLKEARPGTVAVERVVAGGPAYTATATLAAGDEIVSINGRVVSGMGMADARQYIAMETAAARLGSKPVRIIARRAIGPHRLGGGSGGSGRSSPRAALEGGMRFSPPASPTRGRNFNAISK